jgi:hypothetical protein
MQAFAQQRTQLEILKADIRRAKEIQAGIPRAKADCERFENSLVQGAQGYSSITSEISDFSHHVGVSIENLNFRSAEITGRGITELEIDATVTGSYRSVVRFINALQRSNNLYVVQRLALASGQGSGESSGTLRVSLHIKSYVKSAVRRSS